MNDSVQDQWYYDLSNCPMYFLDTFMPEISKEEPLTERSLCLRHKVPTANQKASRDWLPDSFNFSNANETRFFSRGSLPSPALA